MRVLVISATFPPMRSGGADYAFRLCQRLAEAGIDVRVLTSRIAGVATDVGLTVDPVMQRWSWSELPRLLRIAYRYRPDVINLHFNNMIYNDQPMITLVLTLLKRFLPGVRIVTHIESPGGVRNHLLPRVTRAIRKALIYGVGKHGFDYGYGTVLRDSDSIIVLSGAHGVELQKHYPAVREKCVLIPPPPIMLMCAEENGLARKRGRQMLQVTPDEFVIAHYGYINPDKGIETLFEALASVVKQNCKVRLLMLGGYNEVVLKELKRPNYIEELRSMAAELGIMDKITWTGYYPTDSYDASLYLRGADICVLPFIRGVYLNNSSFSAAVAHGLPTIATKAEFVEFPFIHQKNVLFCPAKDSEALAAAITTLTHNSELRRQLSIGALEMAQEWFCWDKAVERTIKEFAG